MAKDTHSRLRNTVVVTFTLLSVILVFSIWIERLVVSDVEQPGYIRSTISIPTSEGFDLTLTAQPTGGGGQGGRQGGGHGDEHDAAATPSPTFDLETWATEDVSDDLRDE